MALRTLVLLTCALASSATLTPHPRLLLTQGRLNTTQAFIKNNTQAAAYFTALLAQGEYVLGLPPIARPPPSASDILAAARAVLQVCARWQSGVQQITQFQSFFATLFATRHPYSEFTS